MSGMPDKQAGRPMPPVLPGSVGFLVCSCCPVIRTFLKEEETMVRITNLILPPEGDPALLKKKAARALGVSAGKIHRCVPVLPIH